MHHNKTIQIETRIQERISDSKHSSGVSSAALQIMAAFLVIWHTCHSAALSHLPSHLLLGSPPVENGAGFGGAGRAQLPGSCPAGHNRKSRKRFEQLGAFGFEFERCRARLADWIAAVGDVAEVIQLEWVDVPSSQHLTCRVPPGAASVSRFSKRDKSPCNCLCMCTCVVSACMSEHWCLL